MLKVKFNKNRDFEARRVLKSWYLKGLPHRESGPAFEWNDGYKEWHLNSRLHREDGPAIEHSNGYKEWYLNDVDYTESEYNVELKLRGLK